MKNIGISIAALTLALASGSAFATDLPTLQARPVSAAPTPMWTGFYAGLNAGGTWAANNNVHVYEVPTWFNLRSPSINSAKIVAAATAAGSSITIPMQENPSFLGGAQVGYNKKVLDRVVVGVEADFQGIINSGATKTAAQTFQFDYPSINFAKINSNTVYNLFSASKNISYLGTVRGRVGYLVLDNLLSYCTGGLAYGGVSLNTYTQQQNSNGVIDELPIGSSQNSSTRIGWTAGGGLEWFFMPNWSAKAEYLYYSLASTQMNMGQAISTRVVSGGGSPAGEIGTIQNLTAQTAFNGNIVRAGLNYHFNFASAPVVAKY